jgi:hypothetical protein
MFTAIAAGATTFWGWIQRNPLAQWIGAVALFLIGWTVLKNHLKEAGAQAERAAIAKKQAEVKAAVVERVSEIATEERTAADEALEARSTDVHYPSADLVPESLQTIGFRNPRGS